MGEMFGDIAKKLRKKSIDTENHLRRYLKGRQLEGFKFRRQEPTGNYIVDFVNFTRKIIIEVDRSRHFVSKEKDRIRG